MATFGDLKKLRLDVLYFSAMFGMTEEGAERIRQLMREAGTAIMEEQGITDPKEAASLPEGTILGEKAQTAMEAIEAIIQ